MTGKATPGRARGREEGASRTGRRPGRVRPASAAEAERRRAIRYPVRDFQVDLRSGETFLYAYVKNISEMGIFVAADPPLPVGSRIAVRFPASGAAGPLTLRGTVRWINTSGPGARDPGMGIGFSRLRPRTRERVIALVRTLAYLVDEA